MPKAIKDLMVKVDEYTNSKGEKKARWQRIGAEMQGDDGSTYLVMDRWFNPAGVPDLSGKGYKSIIVWRFDPREDSSAPAQKQASSSSAPGPSSQPNDDIPF